MEVITPPTQGEKDEGAVDSPEAESPEVETPFAQEGSGEMGVERVFEPAREEVEE